MNTKALWQLNWREWQIAAQSAHTQLSGAYLERVTVPERPDFAEGSIKGEWIFRFLPPRGSQARALPVWISLRPLKLAVGVLDVAPKNAVASLPPWIQRLQAELKGARLRGVRAFPNERILSFDWEGWSLVLVLIPARPEAWLLNEGRIIAGSHAQLKIGAMWNPPAAPELTTEPPIRSQEAPPGSTAFLRALTQDLAQEGQALRLNRIQRECRERLKKLGALARAATQASEAAACEPDYATWAGQLLAHAHENPRAKNGVIALQDFESGAEITIPILPKEPDLSAAELARRYYALAKRKLRRAEEGNSRAAVAHARIERLKTILAEPRLSHEAELGLTAKSSGLAERTKKSGEPPGKAFTSQEGWPILVGRNKRENLDLTLKYARGNDMWLHLRGRPSAHAVIPIPSGKSVPLDALLDAAQLILHYAGGSQWGTTEVDYTFRKHVKRIPKSDEVSYTQSKTLLVKPDPARLKRLLGGEQV